MLLAVAIGLTNGVKSIFISAILYIFAIDFILVILRDSNSFNFFWIKFPLLIPYLLVGVFALIQTKILLPDKFKFRNYSILGIIALILLFIFLLINKADKNSQIYFVLKSSVNFCFIFISLIITNQGLNVKKNEYNDSIGDLKKNKRFLLILFVTVIADMVNMCVCTVMSEEIPHILFYSVSLIAILSIGYNELFSNKMEYISLESMSEENCEDLINDISETKLTVLAKNDPIVNKTSLGCERVSEIATKIDQFFLNNQEFQRDHHNKLINLSELIKEKPTNISYVLKTHYNTNYNNYINSLRIEEAKNIIANNIANHNIEEIGVMVGFNTKNSFYIAFKKLTGVTPAKYREVVD